MDENFAKVLAFVVFICLGWFLRKRSILKPEAFHAISGLVLYVTLPCTIFTNLNGVKIEGVMLTVALLGLLSNFIFLGVAKFLTRREKDAQHRDFFLQNFGGYSIGPMAVPFVQAFYPTTGLLTACMFDVGNVVMSGGGTYAIIAGSREHGGFLRFLKTLASKMVRSGPLMAFFVMVILSVLDLKFPDTVITITRVGALANMFLCMIMIGETINLKMTREQMKKVAVILFWRWCVCIVFALASWFVLPFEGEVRIAMVLVSLAPIPPMSLIYTAQLKGDIGLAANLNSISVLCSIAAMSSALMLLGLL